MREIKWIEDENSLAMKNFLTRFYLSKNPEYKNGIVEINTDDYLYVIDYIDRQNKIKKESNDAVQEFRNEIEKLENEFKDIFNNKKEINEELKKEVLELLYGEATDRELTEEDKEIVVNLFRRDFYIKKIQILNDWKKNNSNNQEKVNEKHYKYLEEKYGISIDEINEKINTDEKAYREYSKFLASFYSREYELAYLTEELEERENKIENLTNSEVNRLIENKVKEFNEKMPHPFSGRAIQILNSKEEWGIELEKKLENFIKNPEEYFSSTDNSEYKNEIIDCYKRMDYKDTIDKIINTYLYNIFNHIDITTNPDITNIKNFETKFKFELSKNLGISYKYIDPIINVIYKVNNDILEEYKKEEIEKIKEEINGKREEIKEKIKKVFYFRADSNYNEGNLFPTNRESRIAPQTHIAIGSRQIDSPYMSLTGTMAVAATYMADYSNGKVDLDKRRASIIMIDMNKLYELMQDRKKYIEEEIYFDGEKGFISTVTSITQNEIKQDNEKEYKNRNFELSEGILDFSTYEAIKEQNIKFKNAEQTLYSDKSSIDGKEKTTQFSDNYAIASREILIKGAIPAEVIKVIDPLTFDSLFMITTHAQMQEILDNIDSFNMLDLLEEYINNSADKINKFEFNEQEEYFLKEYYYNNKSLNDIFKNISKEDGKKIKDEEKIVYDKILREKILDKILNNEDFIKDISSKTGINLITKRKNVIPLAGVERTTNKEGKSVITQGICYKEDALRGSFEKYEKNTIKINTIKTSFINGKNGKIKRNVTGTLELKYTASEAAKTLLETINEYGEKRKTEKKDITEHNIED